LARYLALLILLVVPFGVYRDSKNAHYPDLHLQECADRFARAEPGTSMKIPILPPGWEMELIKH
jgi:hypothetical protein